MIRKEPPRVRDRERPDLAVVADGPGPDFIDSRPFEAGLAAPRDRLAHLARASVRAEALGLRIECVHGAVGLRSRKREQLRDLGLMARGFLGALDQLGHSLRAQVVSRRTAGALSLDDPDGEQVPALLDVLGDLVVGEPGQGVAAPAEHDLDLRAARQGDRLIQLGLCFFPEHQSSYPTPTRTFRKRAGAAPCVISPTWPGCPLPQFTTPHGFHSSGPQMESHEFQKPVVIPW